MTIMEGKFIVIIKSSSLPMIIASIKYISCALFPNIKEHRKPLSCTSKLEMSFMYKHECKAMIAIRRVKIWVP